MTGAFKISRLTLIYKARVKMMIVIAMTNMARKNLKTYYVRYISHKLRVEASSEKSSKTFLFPMRMKILSNIIFS